MLQQRKFAFSRYQTRSLVYSSGLWQILYHPLHHTFHAVRRITLENTESVASHS